MRNPIVIVAASLCLLSLGCSPISSPSPSLPNPSPSTVGSVEPVSSEMAPGQLMGAWRPASIQLGDPQIAVISDACAAAAREQLGEAEANLPTALVDARGEGRVTAILADDTRAIECLARIDDAGAATVDSVERLAPSAIAPVTDQRIGLTSLIEVADRQGSRTVLLGRVGPNAFKVQVGFDDKSRLFASSANGWHASWWPGLARPAAIVVVDKANLVIGTVPVPKGQVDGRLGAASWWLDPQARAPTAASTTVRALVLEEACASGKTPAGRIELPLVDLSETAVTVTFGIRPLRADQDCQGNAPFRVTFKLPEPLAERTLLDGNTVPPRDASKPPTG